LEAVILAAGRGQRMEGLAKPFYKPLLEINGMPLVAYAIEYASAAGAELVTVVTSTSNHDDIAEAVSSYSRWARLVVQEEPAGPGHATLVALLEAEFEQTMLLMSDNIMNQNEVVEMAMHSRITGTDAVGVRTVTPEQASRFTRIQDKKSDKSKYTFVEGTPIGEEDTWHDGSGVKVWCGPLIFDTGTAIRVLADAWIGRDHDNVSEMKIGPHLNKIMLKDPQLFDVAAFDVGIPSAYIAQMNGGRA